MLLSRRKELAKRVIITKISKVEDMGALEQVKKYNLPDRVYRDIVHYAITDNIDRVILFGSRARGTNRERSDIDLAVSGGNFDDYYWHIHENAHTLLMFDLIDVDRGISEELKKEIEKDGVIIYEKNR